MIENGGEGWVREDWGKREHRTPAHTEYNRHTTV